jgi:copper chaperone CopZ
MRAKLGIAAGIIAVIASIGGAHRPNSASPQAEDKEIIISVPGIPGPYCAYGVEKRLKELGGVRRVDVLWEEEIIRAYFDDGVAITRDRIEEAMTKADYPYEYTIVKP